MAGKKTRKAGLYAIASKVRDEAFLDSQLQMAGSNQARVLERLGKNSKDAKNQALVVKIIYGIVLGALPVLPLFMYVQVSSLIAGGLVAPDAVTFISVLLLVFYFGMVSMYLFILGVMSVSGFMSGDVFQWIEVLPIPRRDVQKVGLVVLWRFFDFPIIVVVAVFPTIMALISGNVLVFLACLGVSILTGLFLFCIIIIVAEKFNRILKGDGSNSRKATFIRSIAVLGYVIVMMSAGLVINLAIQAIAPLFASLSSMSDAATINVLLGFIPFPFAPSFLVSFAFMPPGSVPAPLAASTMVGFALFLVMVWRLYRRVLAKLRNVTSHQARTGAPAQAPAGSTTVRDIIPVPPVKAYKRKDLASLTRDFQGAMYLFIPVVLPFITFLPSMQGMQAMAGVDLYFFISIFLVMLVVMDAGMLVSGLLGIEDSGASIAASLPVVPRDQVKAKLGIMCPLQLASTLIPLLFVIGFHDFPLLAAFFLGLCLVSVAVAMLTLATKVRLFGKMRYKYVLDEANVERKTLKWLAIVCMDAAIAIGLLVMVMVVGGSCGAVGVVIAVFVAGGAGLALALVILDRMFPRLRDTRHRTK
ncbi:MAG: hypothetical protein JW839_07625 [Candidatus Lokiarchaeota archaeon]|nr:hypothetical protein [Candidatus Lokiarchaeota archaeon]